MTRNSCQKKLLIFGCILAVLNSVLFPFALSFAAGMTTAGDGFGRSIDWLVNGFYVIPLVLGCGIALSFFVTRSDKVSNIAKVFFWLYVCLVPLTLICGFSAAILIQ
ncbi:MAG: hypothetical protein AB7S78_12350 [Candidatus Omnitrophota bacterium]